ncbi:hypothetical protein GALL_23510 [mine drainage metagenome]|uniref:Uncharacterized protein n=1 Tax=mine drainage metagenome TaxID=410659 RepID=A0A1J5TZ61_9ZZZZ
MGNIDGLKWALYYAEKKKKRQEQQRRTRNYIETQIEWQLPESMLPVRCKKFKQKKYSIFNVPPLWYINGSDKPQSFVYVLKDIDNNEVRYVGLTEDPPRRKMEHQRDNKLNGNFKMVIVAVGDADTEREWIARCIKDGCKLINVVSIKPN